MTRNKIASKPTKRNAGREVAPQKRAPRPRATTSTFRGSKLVVPVIAALLAFLLSTFPGLLHSLDLFGSGALVRSLWEQLQGAPVATDNNVPSVPEDAGCIALAHWLPDITYLPGSDGFANQWRAHWAEQAQNAVASCVAKPRNATEVSQVVKVLKNLYDLPFLARARGTGAVVDHNIRFVVRSGGHNVEVGQSSINGGVLIDLAALNFIEPSNDRLSVKLGPAARWGEVFDQLEAIGLTTAGGRNGRVGVGGLSLGGGLSWLSPQVGMVSDNIVEYEVVLANGTIVFATEDQHLDLWRALKGGSGNFGIVTSFKARTFPATEVWGGYIYYYLTNSVKEKLLNAIHAFAAPKNFDQYASFPIAAIGSLRIFGLDISAGCVHILHTKPQPWPSVWNGFKSIFYVFSQAKVRTYASAAEELVSVAAYGLQQYQATLTVKNDIETMRGLYALSQRSWKKVRHVKGVMWNVVFQPLPSAILDRSSTSPLGLDTRNATESLVIVLLCPSWKDPSQNDFMYQAVRELIASMEVHAMLRGTLDPYIYLNYAASWQNVFASYGDDNHEFLRSVSRKYDEYGFWQNARAGGFKLGLERPGSEAYPSHERSSVWEQPVHTPPAHVHGSGEGHAHHDHHHHHHPHDH